MTSDKCEEYEEYYSKVWICRQYTLTVVLLDKLLYKNSQYNHIWATAP